MSVQLRRLGVMGFVFVLGAMCLFGASRPVEKQPVGGDKVKMPANAPAAPPGTRYRKLTITEPKVHKNLAIYLICGKDAFSTKDIVSLNEALEKKMIVVHETGNVNQLAVENVSDKTIFIHAGDIVRGGKQDRTLPNDMLLRPKSGKTPVDSFCVEQGRWRARTGNSVGKFDSSANNAYGNDSKLAMRKGRSQGGVWRSVATKQRRISVSVGGSVQAAASESSLELTMDHKKVQEAIVGFQKAFKDYPAGKDNSIGLVIVINGKIYCADTYASHDLFMKVWPKLLKGAAVEAIAHPKPKAGVPKLPNAKAVMDFLTKVRIGKKSTRRIDKNTFLLISEIEGETLFRTIDQLKGQSIHDSYVVEEKGAQPVPQAVPGRVNDQIQLRNSSINSNGTNEPLVVP